MPECCVPARRRITAIIKSEQTGLPAAVERVGIALAELQELVERSRNASENSASAPHLNFSNADNERVFGEEAILARIALLAEEVTTRVDTFSPGYNYPMSHIKAAQANDEKALARGIKSRGIYLTGCLKYPPMVEHLKWSVAHGANVRTTLELPIRMIIGDQRIAVLPLDLSDGMNGILIVKDAATVQALCALFETYWAAATPFGTIPTASKEILNERDIEILHLLSEALTDRQIGRRMGFSERTASSAVETVRRKLGARNRFELGVIAAKEGWL